MKQARQGKNPGCAPRATADDEFGVLAGNFNEGAAQHRTMVTRLSEAVDGLAQRSQRLAETAADPHGVAQRRVAQTRQSATGNVAHSTEDISEMTRRVEGSTMAIKQESGDLTGVAGEPSQTAARFKA